MSKVVCIFGILGGDPSIHISFKISLFGISWFRGVICLKFQLSESSSDCFDKMDHKTFLDTVRTYSNDLGETNREKEGVLRKMKGAKLTDQEMICTHLIDAFA